ncbi:thiamin pyrophosphokinase 1-like isoform X4 [Gordionus sp. m RMFG-2023]|uniref:thiamin pyrophosphokinase 1-like isoform X4 n=1 Tax=Gordionus sp. m RMFG-2023 TaxID=3053472 RepID=UPI0031FBFD68
MGARSLYRFFCCIHIMKANLDYPEKVIKPLKIFQSSFLGKSKNQYNKSILLILNNDIFQKNNIDSKLLCDEYKFFEHCITKLWSGVDYIALTDGAINIIEKINLKLSNNMKPFIPDLIAGDLDSSDIQLLSKFNDLGTNIIKINDQNQTDFTKTIRVIGKILGGNLSYLSYGLDDSQISFPFNAKINFAKTKNNDIYYEIIVLGGLNGRDFIDYNNKIDNHYSKPNPLPLIYLVSPQSFEGEACGLINFAGKCKGIITQGLKWNLNLDDTLEFGKMISTSNSYNFKLNSYDSNTSQDYGNTYIKEIKLPQIEKIVTITTLNEPIIWTMEINIPINI